MTEEYFDKSQCTIYVYANYKFLFKEWHTNRYKRNKRMREIAEALAGCDGAYMEVKYYYYPKIIKLNKQKERYSRSRSKTTTSIGD